MRIIKYIFVFAFTVLLNTEVFSTHIVGGELYYDNLGGNNYKITLKVYRDCINGTAPFDGLNSSTCYLHIFDSNGNLVSQIDMGIPSVTLIPPSINNPCIQTPSGICVEEGVYTTQVNLPPKVGGYNLVYQRCCRNNTILNLVNPGAQGSSYQAFIPGPEKVTVNSSPRYSSFPPIFICNGLKLNFNHAATDPDGDQLVYSLCPPFDGLDPCCPIIAPGLGASSSAMCINPPSVCPSVAVSPPYSNVNFSAPYTGSYPISSNPSITINPNTGLLSGTPNLNGQWVIGVCVQEFRNGQLISTHYRDFQFNVVTCSVTVLSSIKPQLSKCQGDTINFVNQSVGANSYHWDFGVNSSSNDTSNLFSPTFVFPDTGIYNVTLIANPGKPCADTSEKKFYIYPKLKIKFPYQAPQCLKNNSFNFSVTGTYINSATFNWTFGAVATPSVSTSLTPSNVVFSEPGKFFIKLKGKQLTCIDSFIDSVRIIGRPKALIKNFPSILCDPAKVSFSNGSISEYPPRYIWQTSDGATYTSYEPSHVFTPSGVYSVTLTLIRDGVCPDTSKAIINTFTVNPLPIAGFKFTPTLTTIFDPQIYFENTASNDVVKWLYEFGDGFNSTFMNEIHTYENPGTYTITQYVTNQYECSDTISKELKILPEFRFWIPNTFTPDENGLNDEFMPITIGVSDYTFNIYDRWGEKIYSGTDPKKGWNGFYKGKLCKEDVYVWIISFKNAETEKREMHTGHVLLLKQE